MNITRERKSIILAGLVANLVIASSPKGPGSKSRDYAKGASSSTAAQAAETVAGIATGVVGAVVGAVGGAGKGLVKGADNGAFGGAAVGVFAGGVAGAINTKSFEGTFAGIVGGAAVGAGLGRVGGAVVGGVGGAVSGAVAGGNGGYEVGESFTRDAVIGAASALGAAVDKVQGYYVAIDLTLSGNKLQLDGKDLTSADIQYLQVYEVKFDNFIVRFYCKPRFEYSKPRVGYFFCIKQLNLSKFVPNLPSKIEKALQSIGAIKEGETVTGDTDPLSIATYFGRGFAVPTQCTLTGTELNVKTDTTSVPLTRSNITLNMLYEVNLPPSQVARFYLINGYIYVGIKDKNADKNAYLKNLPIYLETALKALKGPAGSVVLVKPDEDDMSVFGEGWSSIS